MGNLLSVAVVGEKIIKKCVSRSLLYIIFVGISWLRISTESKHSRSPQKDTEKKDLRADGGHLEKCETNKREESDDRLHFGDKAKRTVESGSGSYSHEEKMPLAGGRRRAKGEIAYVDHDINIILYHTIDST